MSLTTGDRTLVQNLFSQGPSALVEEGLSMEDVRDFLARPECADYMSLLLLELDHVEEIEARNRMIARRGMARMKENAVVILAMAMAGPQYAMHEVKGQQVILKDGKDKPILSRMEPSLQQVKAATFILECMGVPTQKSTIASGGPPTMDTMLKKDDSARRANIGADPGLADDADRRRSRERMRNLIERLIPEIPGIRERIGSALGLSNGVTTTKKKARKKTKKKTTKKIAKKTRKKVTPKKHGRKKKKKA